jgi:hypothetical protein
MPVDGARDEVQQRPHRRPDGHAVVLRPAPHRFDALGGSRRAKPSAAHRRYAAA